MGWQDDFLRAIGAPNTPNNQGNVNAWAQCEGGLANNNPFNTTRGGPGAAGAINSVGVKRFDSLGNGVAANVATIQQPNFSPLLNALRQDASRGDFAATLGSVPWGTNPRCVSSANGKPVGGSPAPAPSGSGGGQGCFATAPIIGGCLISKSNLKALKGALTVGGGVALLSIGAILIVSAGLHDTNAGRAAVRSAAALPLVARMPTRYSRTTYPTRSTRSTSTPRANPERNRNPAGSVSGLSPKMQAERARFKAREREAARYSPPQREFDSQRADVDEMF